MKHLELTITIMDVKEPDLLDFTSLLYDIELIHDLYILTLSEKYKDKLIDFKRFPFRDGRPLLKEDRLKLKSIRKESPFEIGLLAISIEVSLILLLETLKKAFNLGEKGLEMRKKWWESEDKKYDALKKKHEYFKTIQGDEAKKKEENYVNRLKKNRLQIENINIDEEDSKDDHTFI